MSFLSFQNQESRLSNVIFGTMIKVTISITKHVKQTGNLLRIIILIYMKNNISNRVSSLAAECIPYKLVRIKPIEYP